MILERRVLSRYGDLGSQGRYCPSARLHQDGVGSMTVRLPEGRVYSQIEGPRDEAVGRHGARIATSLSLPRHVTTSDGSVGPDCMGAGFTWMDSSLKRCGSERIGREEEWTSSGRAELIAGRIHSDPEGHSRLTRLGNNDRQ